MGIVPKQLKRRSACIISLVSLATLTAFCQLPQLNGNNLSSLAKPFAFKRAQLPLTAQHPAFKFDRQLHPSLQRVSAWIAALGAAVTLADLDGDGLPNEYVLVDPRTDQVIIGPVPGSSKRFEPFALNAGSLKYDPKKMAPMGSVACDFNEDGLQDLLVYYWGRTPIIFLKQAASNTAKLNNASYLPVELAPEAALWSSCAVAVADLDGDGHQDIVIGNYFPDGSAILDSTASGTIGVMDSNSHACNGGHKHFFLWKSAKAGPEPAVQFEEQKSILDEPVSCGWTLGLSACDLDGDHLPEIYIANDVGPDRLLHNHSTPGKLKFTCMRGRGNFSTPTSFILGEDPFKGMGVDFADINYDGIPDIYVSNIAQPWGLQESHFMFVSDTKQPSFKDEVAPYSQQSEVLGLSRGGWAWDCRLADFDNDSVFEAIQAKGFIKGNINRWPEAQSLATCNNAMLSNPRNWPAFLPGADISGDNPNSFYVRAKNDRFYDLAQTLGLDDRLLARGIAIADTDGDGKLDFAVANQWNASFYFHNESPAKNAFLNLHLVLPVEASTSSLQIPSPLSSKPELSGIVKEGHPAANVAYRPAIGAKAVVHLPDGRRLCGQVDGGSGHSGKRSSDLHFGLGDLPSDKPLEVEVSWRDSKGAVQGRTLKVKPGVYTITLVRE